MASVPKYFPELKVESPLNKEEVWTGYRPLSPDGLPMIGRLKKFKNLYVNSGQGMMGMSLGPISGKILADTILGKKPKLEELDFLDVNRF